MAFVSGGPTSAAASFAMPSGAVTATAVYEDIACSITVGGITVTYPPGTLPDGAEMHVDQGAANNKMIVLQAFAYSVTE